MSTQVESTQQIEAFEDARAEVIAEVADKTDAMLRSIELMVRSMRRKVCEAGSVQFVDDRPAGDKETAADLFSEMMCDDFVRDWVSYSLNRGDLDGLENPESASELIQSQVRDLMSGAVYESATK